MPNPYEDMPDYLKYVFPINKEQDEKDAARKRRIEDLIKELPPKPPLRPELER